MASIPPVEVPVNVKVSVERSNPVRAWVARDKDADAYTGIYVGSQPSRLVRPNGTETFCTEDDADCLIADIDLKLLGIHLKPGECKEVTITVAPVSPPSVDCCCDLGGTPDIKVSLGPSIPLSRELSEALKDGRATAVCMGGGGGTCAPGPATGSNGNNAWPHAPADAKGPARDESYGSKSWGVFSPDGVKWFDTREEADAHVAESWKRDAAAIASDAFLADLKRGLAALSLTILDQFGLSSPKTEQQISQLWKSLCTKYGVTLPQQR